MARNERARTLHSFFPYPYQLTLTRHALYALWPVDNSQPGAPVTDPIERARAEAIHACAAAQRRAEALERDLDRITQLLELNQVGRLTAIAATLAEHEHRLTQLEAK